MKNYLLLDKVEAAAHLKKLQKPEKSSRKINHEEAVEKRRNCEIWRLERRILDGWRAYQFDRTSPRQPWIYAMDRHNLWRLKEAINRLIDKGIFDNCQLQGFKSKESCGIKVVSLR